MFANVSRTSFLDSNKGHQQLIMDGFIYKMNKKTSSKLYWTCKIKNCTAKVHTDPNNNFLKRSGEHNHLIEPGNVEVQSFRKILKNRVVNETLPITKIYDEEIAKAQFSSEILASVPMVYNIRKIKLPLTIDLS